jgi:hypothetical protein
MIIMSKTSLGLSINQSIGADEVGGEVSEVFKAGKSPGKIN